MPCCVGEGADTIAQYVATVCLAVLLQLQCPELPDVAFCTEFVAPLCPLVQV